MVFLQDDRFFLILYFVFMLLSWKEDLCINGCSWIFNSMNVGGENQLSAQNSCVLPGLAALGCVQPSCWELAWSHEGTTRGPTEPEMQSGTGMAWTVLAERTQNASLLYSRTVCNVWRKEFWAFALAVCVLPGNRKAEEPKAVVWSMYCRSCSAVLSGEGEVDLGMGKLGKHFWCGHGAASEP